MGKLRRKVMANLNAKTCPISSAFQTPCSEAQCAWWDKIEAQCIIKTAAQKIIGRK